MRYLPCGERGVLIECADLDETLRLFAPLREAVQRAHEAIEPDAGATRCVLASVTELVPAARTILVAFDPLRTSRRLLVEALQAVPIADSVDAHAKTVEIPVTYDGEDLADVARLLGVSETQIVERHSASPWSVAFVGFAPGFAYLVGGDALFDVPRRSTPRVRVPAGSVGLAGTFSGVYPRESSGGWQLIGRTDAPMWDLLAETPALLQPGDAVRFVPVRECVAAASPVEESERKRPSDKASERTQEGLDALESIGFYNGLTSERCYLQVVRPGLLATIQDGGRRAANMGVTGSGAADAIAFRLANALVGNAPDAPALEATDGGICLKAQGNVVVAVTGAQAKVTIDGDRGCTEVHGQRAMLLRDGETLEIGRPTGGLRNYVAVRGGFAVAKVLGSASTDTMSGIGPEPLRPRQLLTVGAPGVMGAGECHLQGEHGANMHPSVGNGVPWRRNLPKAGETSELTAVLGPRDDWFSDAGIATCAGQEWEVTAQSNRVGLRLRGTQPIQWREERELASEGTPAGAIQVPPSGQPVVFLRDQPVTGGYPVIAVLTEQSLALAGQLPPGARVRLRLVATE